MQILFQTDRLLLRRFTMDDAPLILELNQDPEVTRYTLDPMVDLPQAREVVEKVILPQYELYNLGRWAVHLKEDLSFLGWCGLKFRPEINEVDLGYRYKQQHWGKGYATEAAAAALDYGFNTLQLTEITGRALPANLASIHVLEKIGMTYIGEEIIEGLLHKTYRSYKVTPA